MKAITNKKDLPKFIKVNGESEKKSYNEHILKPYREGELVKVAPFEKQVPNRKYDWMFPNKTPISVKDFRKRFVKIIRKDDEGKWSLVYVSNWINFDLLTNIKTKK